MYPSHYLRCGLPISLSVTFFALAVSAMAQTITTQSLPQTTFCLDGVIEFDVAFSTDGPFAQGNAFYVQLSNPDGSFAQGYRNISATASDASGVIRVSAMPFTISPGSAYRIRVVSTKPVVFGSDNGVDLTFRKPPVATITVDGVPPDRLTPWMALEEPLTLQGAADGGVTYVWNFGEGAIPETAEGSQPPPVRYVSEGLKQITLTGTSASGCGIYGKKEIEIIRTNPAIGNNARIVTAGMSLDLDEHDAGHVWVCPGGEIKLTRADKGTIFVEPGGAIVANDGTEIRARIYMRNGASYSVPNGGSWPFDLVVEDGASLVGAVSDVRLRNVPVLTFDYSQVPPNGCPSLAPYIVQLEPDVRSIVMPEEEDGSNAEYYISGSASLTSRGSNNAYYLEPGSRVIVRGDSSRIYVKAGASVDVVSGRGHRIFYELDANVVSPGEDAVLLPSSGITYVGLPSSVVHADRGEALIRVYPNPVRDELHLELDEELGSPLRAYVVDGAGRVAITAEPVADRIALHVGELTRGVYFVHVTTERGEYVRRVVLE